MTKATAGNGTTTHGISPLDRAHALRLGGEREASLRLASSLLNASDDCQAALLVARLLLDAGRAVPAGEAAEVLCERFARRGDLPSACLAAQLGREAGGYAEEALQRVAEAFGKGSVRVDANVSLRPPPLPTPVEVAPFFAKLAGAELLDAAAKALARFVASKDPVPAGAPLPRLPLFSELEPALLRRLLGAFSVRELAAGAYALRQGEEGREAFVLVRGVLNVVREDELGAAVLAVLGPGAIFGEMALVSDAPRAASVVAVEACQVLVAARAQLEQLAREDRALGAELAHFCQRRMVSNLIRHSPILSAVEPARRAELVSRFTPRAFEAGELLLRQGEEHGRLYLIASGGVEVCGREGDGEPVVLAQLGPGDVVGEISLVLRRPATADVIALHSTVALELTRERFQEAIKEHPALLRELYDLAATREEQTASVVGQKALDVSDVVLL